jgi:hypothetical protein
MKVNISSLLNVLSVILKPAFAVYLIRFGQINYVVKIIGTTSDIFLAAIGKDFSTFARYKIMSVFAFNDITTQATLAPVEYNHCTFICSHLLLLDIYYTCIIAKDELWVNCDAILSILQK